MSFVARPGTGGRRRRLPQGFETDATRELLAELGKPQIDTYNGTQLNVWRVSDEPGGILAARLSTEDIQQGETAMGQIHVLREMAERLSLAVRFIIVAVKTSGGLPYDERLDLAFIASQIRAREASYVAFRQPDRIARHTLPAETFYHELEQHGVDLYLSALGRKVDWRADRLYLLTSGMFSEHERAMFKERAHGALHRRFLETGRGWPGAIRFGFRRRPDKLVEIDPEQWVFIERIHYDYATLFDGRGSVQKLADHLADLGCRLARETVRRILRDPIYVTGEYAVTVEGRTYPGGPIPLPNPIPREVFDRNQRLLDSCHGANSVVPFGFFLLNYVPLLHARCMQQTINGRQPRLSGRAWSNKRKSAVPTYTHVPRTPEMCRGYSIPARELEHAVIDRLRGLAQSPELQLEWARAGRPARLLRGELTAEQRDGLRAKTANMRRQRERVMRAWLDDCGSGQSPDDRYLREALMAIDAEIQSHQRQLDLSDTLARQREAEDSSTSAAGSVEVTDRLLEVLTPDPPDDADLRQRRVAVIKAVLSAVVVHDSDEGIALELHGPLVPGDTPLVPISPVDSAREVLDAAPELPSKATLSGQFGGSQLVPAWRSPRLPTTVFPFEGLTLERCKDAVLYAHTVAPAGPLFARRGGYGAAVASRPEFPGCHVLYRECARHGVRPSGLAREVLGDDGLRLGRWRDLTKSELVRVVAWAIEDGFDPGPGWKDRWDAFAREHPYLRCVQSTRGWAARHGMTMPELFDAARET